MDIRTLIAQAVERLVAEALAGEPTGAAVARMERSLEVLDNAQSSVQQRAPRRQSGRLANPAVGYHATDKRTANGAAKKLAHNFAVVLADVANHPGTTNRQTTERLVKSGALKAESARKAVESALYWLRTHDADGNETRTRTADGWKNIRGAKPLVESRAL
jgi:hypothetical protein